jgi:hypothetical protein
VTDETKKRKLKDKETRMSTEKERKASKATERNKSDHI